MEHVNIWKATPATDKSFRGMRVMRGGPRAMYLPEHEHVETQIQSRFRPTAGSNLEPAFSALYAPYQPHAGGIETGWEVIVMLLDPGLMTEAAGELFSRDRFEIKPFRMLRSPFVEQLTGALRHEMNAPSGPDRFFVESIGHVMAGYLLRQHAVTGPVRTPRGSFSTGQLRRIDSFIDERLGYEFGVNDLAGLMQLGPQRFSERFRLTTRMSPWQYVQLRRIRRARQLLADPAIPLAEVALRLGFSNQSHFVNVFRRATGVTPRVFRNRRG